MKRRIKTLLNCPAVLIAAALFSPSLLAQDVLQVTAIKISEKIQVDGRLDEPVWNREPSIGNFTQVEPRSGDAPTEATRVWVGYTESALYIAVRCADSEPRRIVANDMGRDVDITRNDRIEVVLDTFHDHHNGYYFATNPVGAMVDGRVTENSAATLDWDGIWNVRARMDQEGWTAEFEIPFKTIGFNAGLKEWGINFSRFIGRNRETDRWAAPSLDFQLNQVVQAGHLTGLEGLTQGIGLDVKPFGITGFTRDITAADQLRGARSGGADVFYRVTPNLISATTFNTDFAETEVDTRQVNLTRFALYFPEKRAFFLEDAGIFQFAGMGSSSGFIPFFSRTIGLVKGQQAPIRAGEKLTGKIGRFDVGVIDVQTGDLTQGTSLLAPGTNLAVARAKGNFWSQSYVGGIFTNGNPVSGDENRLGGVDLKLATSNFLKTRKNLSLTLFGTKTSTPGLSGRDFSYGGTISFPNDLISASYSWQTIGENFNPALGFLTRKGVRTNSVSTEFSRRPKKLWRLRKVNLGFDYTDYYNLSQHALETRQVSTTPYVQLNGGGQIGFSWTRNYDRLFQPWTISRGVTLPAGEYTYDRFRPMTMSATSKPVYFSLTGEFGRFYSGTNSNVNLSITWKTNRNLTQALSLRGNWVRLKEGRFNAHLASYRLVYSFTPFITLSNYVQYDTVSRNIGLQSRLRWILRPGNEFFIVLNHAWQEDQFDRFEAAQARFRAKVNYTFRF